MESSKASSSDAHHPAVWRASALGRGVPVVWSTGFEYLDHELPGGGWPCGVLTELLLPQDGVGELRLLAPTLARHPGPVLMADPPAMPCAEAWLQMGVAAERLLVIHARQGPRSAALRERLPAVELLWAVEQALRSAQLGAAMVWMSERLGAQPMRRLQLAAQAHRGPVFLFRAIEARQKPSPAPLRLTLHAGERPDALRVHILKRQGPAHVQALNLALQPVLPTSALRRWADRQGAPSAEPAALRLSHAQPLQWV